ncbi:protocatechuate 3,4-dioxygenase subunit alpha [Umezawaea sp. Da 62-37]|uniref:protocatechuate 3,4-dioxygenase subunit alpha n=1 Tax=Umezawaea sp. Da 62-37 TaxID=3075927 RepID=UPI0028F6F1C2|nr:protocatechuate 3,4-dioxygenase subunit alpha [Umezawaea sp. Da 62-37]WNV84358.1 protocatechuate 3,4-dioxygenase subunit alpha [Umezawaea sp. Da 62-37]
MSDLQTTPSQTVGPFFGIGLPWEDGPFVVAEDSPDAFRVAGKVLDGDGAPVPDALIEVWQADPEGRFAHPDDPRGPLARMDFRGFGRSATDESGEFWFHTVKPGALPSDDGDEAPHLNVSIFCRGMLVRLVTRIYFPDEPGNAEDPVLLSLPDPTRRGTLIAEAAPNGYRFDIHLQGDDETVFFDL